jgi:hypothetical protein
MFINVVKIIKEVCFVENHAKLSEDRGINILAFLILIQVKSRNRNRRHNRERTVL